MSIKRLNHLIIYKGDLSKRLKEKRSVHTQEKMQSKDLKQEGNYETDSRSSD